MSKLTVEYRITYTDKTPDRAPGASGTNLIYNDYLKIVDPTHYMPADTRRSEWNVGFDNFTMRLLIILMIQITYAETTINSGPVLTAVRITYDGYFSNK